MSSVRQTPNGPGYPGGADHPDGPQRTALHTADPLPARVLLGDADWNDADCDEDTAPPPVPAGIVLGPYCGGVCDMVVDFREWLDAHPVGRD